MTFDHSSLGDQICLEIIVPSGMNVPLNNSSFGNKMHIGI